MTYIYIKATNIQYNILIMSILIIIVKRQIITYIINRIYGININIDKFNKY